MTLKKIKGTEKRDTLTGGAIAEWLIGLGGNDKLYGNGGADRLDGGDGNDRLDGGLGADRMFGGAGNDAYFIDRLTDKVSEGVGAGVDTIYVGFNYTLGANVENLVLSGSADLTATGNALANQISGNAGSNTIDGLSGADRMAGKGGNDTYYVDIAGDVVVERAASGEDAVYASISHILAANVETLWLTGTGDVSATGNGLGNSLHGNDGANVLDGKAGTDTMSGGLGDDTYYVDNAGDQIEEGFLEGTDTVFASVTFTLASNIENLTLIGTDAIDGHGNSDPNIITGNEADNKLYAHTFWDGDELHGGGGNDTLFSDRGDNTLDGGDGSDDIADYSETATRIRFTFETSATVYKFNSYGTDSLTNIESGRGTSDYDEFKISHAGSFHGGGGADSMYDSIAADGLFGHLYGDAGNDVMRGGVDGGNLDGGDGNDRMFATGGAGTVTMTGGADADQFYIEKSTALATAGTLTAVARITDFVDGTDFLAFYGFGDVDTAEEMYSVLTSENAISDDADGLHIAPGGSLNDTVIAGLTLATFSAADIYMADS
ncbi:calcium-binding protein [Rhizobium alvei]|uniref:Calcium-binding protein n=1 Tax=Rhizobium alvei TaxID=1132659 RepID=A0ABT8YFC2_9HYPH|nr:calcium-binding protein [Rhizobium alvei]MDO6962399.1 calcium-binding protein [Rhizobium alvei]